MGVPLGAQPGWNIKLGEHAHERETSLLFSIAMSNARADYGNMLEEPAGVLASLVRARNDPDPGIRDTEAGLRGDPTLATIEESRLVLANAIADPVAALQPQCP